MRLLELAEKSNLIMEIAINKEHLEFKSVVAAKTKNYILIEAIRINRKVVNFEGSNVQIDLLFVRNEEAPIVWKRVLLKNTVYENRTYYLVVPTGEGFEINRRGAYRMFAGTGGVAQIGFNKMAYDVMVKNVSETGFAFVSKEKFDRPENQRVRLVFYDEKRNLNLNGTIVRHEEMDDDRNVYGCILNVKNQILGRYIMEKQREILAKQRETVAQKRNAAFMAERNKELRESRLDPYRESAQSDEQIKQTMSDVVRPERRELFKRSL